MKTTIFILAFFLAGTAQAQVVGRCYTLLNSTGITSTTTGTGVPITGHGETFLAYLSATENSGTATVDVTLEHAPSCSSTFAALKEQSGSQVSFTQLTATDAMATAKGRAVFFPCVRAVATVGGSGNWDVTVKFCVTE